jgi:hypothetical protein
MFKKSEWVRFTRNCEVTTSDSQDFHHLVLSAPMVTRRFVLAILEFARHNFSRFGKLTKPIKTCSAERTTFSLDT